jgi:poly-gamma-glutamate synthesis protein (capsule biosynthesis protein)
VNHVRKVDGELDEADRRRVLDAIALAAREAEHVVVYHHDHYWHPDWQVTPEWKKRWARSCIDAGAHVFVGHGVPVMHGIEIYRDRPIFYGLGNFIFNLTYHLDHIAEKYATIGNEGYTDPRVWQSVIAKCIFRDGRVQSITLRPISLATQKRDKPSGAEPTGNPRLVSGAEAKQILERMRRLSAQHGTRIALRRGQADVLI